MNKVAKKVHVSAIVLVAFLCCTLAVSAGGTKEDAATATKKQEIQVGAKGGS